jgi:hypothetical protein
MLYLYVNTGHKIGLERLRRGAAILNKLTAAGMETQLLVNDFRAGLVARDLGVSSYVPIETVQDIDAIAEAGNSIIIDSIEDDHGRLVKYCNDFKNVWRFSHDEDDAIVHSEKLIDYHSIFVDDIYFKQKPKEEKLLFFLGDADYDKIILSHPDFFKSINMELLLGNYFFVKYEDDLAKLFSVLHEPEEYESLITTSSTIVTASIQTALEAKVTGAKVIYLDIFKDTIFPVSLLETYGIFVLNGFDINQLKIFLQKNVLESCKSIEKIEDKLFLS